MAPCYVRLFTVTGTGTLLCLALAQWNILHSLSTTTGVRDGESAEQQLQNILSPDQDDKIPIFYNLYIDKEEDVPFVKSIMDEQIALWNDQYHQDVYVTSIGTSLLNLTKPAILYQRAAQGSEFLTLNSIWEYCQNNPSSKVIYLHSKGSFHRNNFNNRMRRFITRGALSAECANLPKFCNVCSAHMSPFPTLHTPGNMWLARCSYVRKLHKPEIFRTYMGEEGEEAYCNGTGRFSAEHWIHAHPENKPCDLYTNPKYKWGYNYVPNLKTFEANYGLAAAPRFHMTQYVRSRLCTYRYNGQAVLDEFQRVYNLTPSRDWWGWRWFTLTYDENPNMR